jgi:pantoate--beta-alanine ligase
MQIFTDIDALRRFLAERRKSNDRVALVPTMGNLHEGHFSLIAEARRNAETVVASVFVNPTQFGPNEDLARYPRTPEQDAAGLQKHGCDALFMPSVETMYPLGTEKGVCVRVPGLGEMLEGASRPGHFDGVATVVSKLFNLVQPDVAIFGAKDYQQLLVIRRFVRDLCFPVHIIGAPIHRESSGLARSSRNQYLDAQQREQASTIYATLVWMRGQVLAGAESLSAIEAAAAERLNRAGFVTDYAVIRAQESLEVPESNSRNGLVALIAARLGSVRLIDNLEISAAI